MTGWVVQLVAIAGVLVSQTKTSLAYVQTLPPAPDQSFIACHDSAWEQQNLLAVAGSRVHTKLAPFVTDLISDAKNDGVGMALTVAYRSCEFQLQLRGFNCGLGDYNLYQKPGNLCAPPTEPAGKSLHNEGLAIDFACNGYGFFESSPCLNWLKQHGGQYHLYNHAIEAWHWSTTGK